MTEPPILKRGSRGRLDMADRHFVDDVAGILADLAVELGLTKAEAKDELRCVYQRRLEGKVGK